MMKLFALLAGVLIGSNAYEKSEGEDTIKMIVQDIAKRDFKPSIVINEFFIKIKGINVTDWTSLTVSGGSTWNKDYKGEEGNFDYMNLTLSLEKMKIEVDQVLIGPLQGKVWFDVGENQGELKMTSKGYVSPGVCEIIIHEAKVTKLDKVIMHSDHPEFEGLDVSDTFQKLGIPLANKFSKTLNFEKYLQHLAGNHCNIRNHNSDNTV